MVEVAFAGFRPDLLDFLRELGTNNNRDWFQAHSAEYQRYLVEPAREFVVAMGECLPALGQDIHAEPRIRGSIMAINRDIRFSKDKSPYKTHLDLWFWQGDGPSRERPGYFFRLQPESLILGAGMHAFSDAALARFRTAILDDTRGRELERIAGQLGVQLSGQTYKRVPSGYPADHPRADWLRFSGLFAATEQPVPAELFSAQASGLCLAQFQRLRPLQQWLVDLLAD
jgi:uncharacterized protein (TIGR02453 family)